MRATFILSAIALAVGVVTAPLAHGAEAADRIAVIAAIAPTPTLAAQTIADAYGEQLRQVLQDAQHYPNSRQARELRPRGTARVWLEIDRSGRLLGAGIAQSSNVSLLDSEALLTVRRATYPAFAAETTAASRRFVVPVEFSIGGSN